MAPYATSVRGLKLQARTWGVLVGSPSSQDIRSWYTTSLVSEAVKKSMPASQPEALAASKYSAATGINACQTPACSNV